MAKQTKTASVISALTARSQFGQIMRRASQKNERFLVDRRGEPSVIIMGLKDYIDHLAPTPPELQDVIDDAKAKGMDKLSMRAINAEIAAVRRERRAKQTLKTPA